MCVTLEMFPILCNITLHLMSRHQHLHNHLPHDPLGNNAPSSGYTWSISPANKHRVVNLLRIHHHVECVCVCARAYTWVCCSSLCWSSSSLGTDSPQSGQRHKKRLQWVSCRAKLVSATSLWLKERRRGSSSVFPIWGRFIKTVLKQQTNTHMHGRGGCFL